MSDYDDLGQPTEGEVFTELIAANRATEECEHCTETALAHAAPACTCNGCWACPGHEPGCTCDVDWDEVFGR